MILFRVRRPGSGEWTNLMVQTPGVEDEEDDMAREISSIIGSALETSSLHVQVLGDRGVWEEIE